MIRRLPFNLSRSLLLLLLVLIVAVASPLVAGVYALEPYPPMVPGQGAGSVSGRVTTNASVGMPGVTVYIVNAADTGIRYMSTTTDSNGYFTVANVNSTNGSAIYRMFATAYGYDNATSNAFSVGSSTTSTPYVIMTRNYSISVPTPTPTPSPGDIAGYVTEVNTTKPLINAKVSLVSADNKYVALTRAYTDGAGYFRFYDIGYVGAPGYMLRVEQDGYEEVYSAPFLIKPDSLVKMNLSLTPAISAATPTPTASPGQNGTVTATPTPTPPASGFFPIPGFEVLAALGGLLITFGVLARK